MRIGDDERFSQNLSEFATLRSSSDSSNDLSQIGIWDELR